MAHLLLEKLLEMEKIKPTDPFVKFCIAQAFREKNEEGKAIIYFQHLLTNFANYLPTYYQYASFLLSFPEVDLEQVDLVLTKGIEVAISQNETKTAQELRGLKEEFLGG